MPQPVQTTPGVVKTFNTKDELEASLNGVGSALRPQDGDSFHVGDKEDLVAVTPATGGNDALELDLANSSIKDLTFGDLRELSGVFSFHYKTSATAPANFSLKLVRKAGGSVTKSGTLLGSWPAGPTESNLIARGEFVLADFTTAGFVGTDPLSGAKIVFENTPSSDSSANFIAVVGAGGIVAGGAPASHGATHAGDGTDPVPNATTTVSGLMSGPDKDKMDRLATPTATQTDITAGTGTLEVKQSAISGKVDVDGIAVLDPTTIKMSQNKLVQATDAGKMRTETATPGSGGDDIEWQDGKGAAITLDDLRSVQSRSPQSTLSFVG